MTKSFIFHCAAACILMTFCVVHCEILVRYHIRRNVDHTSGTANLTCKCGNVKEVVRPINSTMVEDILKENVESGTCSGKYPGDICQLLTTCKTCTIHASKCANGNKKKGKDNTKCNKDIYKFEKYYKEKKSASEDFGNSTHRSKRSFPVSCGYPRNLKTADVSCRIGPKTVRCDQKCINGYTLPSGTKQTRTCKTKENVWKPSGFRECRPYVDCTLALTAPGSIDCYTATTRSSALCYVKCEKYEDKLSMPRRAYECDSNGNWSKKLPFCVRKGSGMNTVPRPK